MEYEHLKDAVQDLAQRIFDKEGGVVASILVKAAARKTEPAHEAFEWDDRIAAKEFRLRQARQWLRIVVVRPTPTAAPVHLVHVPVEVVVNGNREGVYKPLEIVTPDEYMRALSEARRWQAAANRFVNELLRVANTPSREAKARKAAEGVKMIEEALQEETGQ